MALSTESLTCAIAILTVKFVIGLFLSLIIASSNSAWAANDGECFRVLKGLSHILETAFADLETAVFKSGSHAEVLRVEADLRARGVGAIILRDPTVEDVRALTVENGYFYGPLFVTWHKKAQPYSQDIAERNIEPKAQKKKVQDYERKLRKSENLTFEIGPLTNADYLEWYPLYIDWVVGKERGVAFIKENHATKQGATKGDLSNWARVFIRDPESGALVGGVVLQLFRDLGIVKVKGAAFSKEEEWRKSQLAIRTYHESTKYAMEHGFHTLSYGSDSNFYGEFADLGLQRFKAQLGFKPIIWEDGDGDHFTAARIIKILDPKMAAQSQLIFAFKDGDKRSPLEAHMIGEPPNNYSFPWDMKVHHHPRP